MSRMPPQSPARLPASSSSLVLLSLVVLIGLNLRPFLTGPGPLLPGIQADTGLGYGGIAMLTLLPMLLMGLGAFLVPGLQARIGTRRGMLWALILLLLGSLLRLWSPDGLSLILTAALCGAGVAFIQAAFPGLIKQGFPHKVAAATGLYSAMIMGGGAAGAQLTPILAHGGQDWRTALAWLALPVAIALLLAWRVLADGRTTRPDRGLVSRLLRRPRSWQLMACFGLVNGGYSSMVAWLAPYMQGRGWGVAQSGSLVAIMAAAQAVAALILPILAARSGDRRPWLFLTLAMQAAGFGGLAFLPGTQPWLWIMLGGAGLGGCFSLCLITALDHLPRPEDAGALAALMQGGGFLLAGLAPLAVALLQGWSGSFAEGWVMHLAWVAAAALIATRFDPAGYAAAMGADEKPAIAAGHPLRSTGG
ncbi:MFS transporter [Labrys okinawensis]|uniref:MFS transporter n=1 Tax=Labrys okinawensis TaxID=346911 RepID=A0A2S9QE33_9HYPH|nr:cyanate transporter [Labrys okinawensis]PRH87601.1 MFS transporter [Labrys okinawensis]